MNKLIVKNINKKDNRIEVYYDILGEWKKYFNEKEFFFVEYDRNVESVPDSIAIIPFLANILPISWVVDAIVIVDELDYNFYNCLENVKLGYMKMLPQIKFCGKIEVNKMKNSEHQSARNNTARV